MKWSGQHDLELVKEILAERPFDHPKGSRQEPQERIQNRMREVKQRMQGWLH